jgi:hypothetical protein
VLSVEGFVAREEEEVHAVAIVSFEFDTWVGGGISRELYLGHSESGWHMQQHVAMAIQSFCLFLGNGCNYLAFGNLSRMTTKSSSYSTILPSGFRSGCSMYKISSSRGPKTPFGGGGGDSARGFFVRADMSSVTSEFRARFRNVTAMNVQALGRLEEAEALEGSSAAIADSLEGEHETMAAVEINRSVLRGRFKGMKNRNAFIYL